MTMSPAPGVSEESLSAAIEEFIAAVGPERVLTIGEDVREFRDPFEPASWDTYTASAVVLPETVEEIQAIVRAAARHGSRCGRTRRAATTATAALRRGSRASVTVSLRRMNKILEINEELAYAEVEPGVTWRDLYEEITRRGLRLMVSNTDLGWGSVIGNSLEYGFTYGVNGSDHAAACGMEVVTADGRAAANGHGRDGRTTRRGICTRRSFGPSLDRLFMQSNFGIVTKMGVWLLPAPEVYMPVWVRVWKEDDLVAAGRHAAPTAAGRTIEAGPVIYNTLIYAVGVRAAQRLLRRRRADPRSDRSTRSPARSNPVAGCCAPACSAHEDGRRSAVREDQGRPSSRSRARRCGDSKHCVRRDPEPAAPGRARHGRCAQPRGQPHDRLVQRERRRPHLLLPGRTGRPAATVRGPPAAAHDARARGRP